jgi:hypothetical protein
MVIVVNTADALGVQNAVVPEEDGAFAVVTAIPPAVYPAPVASPVAEYAVVDPLTVAVARYSAALMVSAASACVPVKSSCLNDVQIACELGIGAFRVTVTKKLVIYNSFQTFFESCVCVLPDDFAV